VDIKALLAKKGGRITTGRPTTDNDDIIHKSLTIARKLEG